MRTCTKIVLSALLLAVWGCAEERPTFRLEQETTLSAKEERALQEQRAADKLEMEKELAARLGALARKPNDAEAHHKVAFQHYSMGRIDKAIEYWDKALKLDAKHVKSLYGLGVLYHRRDDPKRAFELWEAAVAADPKYWRAYYNIGVEYHNRGQHKKAEEYYRKALAAESTHVKSYINLGLVYFELFRDKDMLAAWEQGLKQKPNDIYLNYNLGAYYAGKVQDFSTVAYRDQDKQDKEYLNKAVEYWRKALRANAPDTPDKRRGLAMINYSLGEYYDYVGDLDEALDYMKQAYALDPSRAQIKHRTSAIARKKRWKGRL